MNSVSNLLTQALVKGASSATLKYIIGPLDNDGKVPTNSSFAIKLQKVCNTIDLLAWSNSNIVEIDGSYYQVSDYYVPKFAQQIIDTHAIYLNKHAFLCAKPLYSSVKHDLNDVMSPLEFNLFWSDYNSRQTENSRIETAAVIRSDSITISDLEIAKTGEDEAIYIGGTRVSSYAVAILDIQIPCLKGYGKSVVLPHDAEVIEWLLGMR